MVIETNFSPKDLSEVDKNRVVSNNTKTVSNLSKVQCDSIALSSQCADLTKAIDTTFRNIISSKNTSHAFPPKVVTNEKQVQIIRKMIEEKLSSPIDDQVLTEAAKNLWKECNFRADDAPPPDPLIDSGSMFDFLTKADRKALDGLYDQAVEQGLDAAKIVRDKSIPISFRREKEEAIRRGVIWGDESNIKPLTNDEWRALIEQDKKTQTSTEIKNQTAKELRTLLQSSTTDKITLSKNLLYRLLDGVDETPSPIK